MQALSVAMQALFVAMKGVAQQMPTLQYWLVDHPTIRNFAWTPGQTFGSTPAFLFTTVVTYLTVTLLLPHAPPSLSRVKPSILRPITTLQNLTLTVLSLAMAVGTVLSILSQAPDAKWAFCIPPGTRPAGPTFFWGYVFYLSKVVEFIDTFLIIVSGSTHRLTFLHVYHHSAVVVLCFLWLQSSQSLFPLAMWANSSVHVIMYSYYFLCGLGFRPWWKKMVTNCQILQFVAGIGVVGPYLYYQFTTESGCSGTWALLFHAGFNVSLLVLFVDFYVKSYARNKKKKEEEVDGVNKLK